MRRSCCGRFAPSDTGRARRCRRLPAGTSDWRTAFHCDGNPAGRGLVSYATKSREVCLPLFVVIIPSTMGLLADAATTCGAAPSAQHQRDIDSTARGTEHPPDRVARTRHPNPRPACAAVRVAMVVLPVRVIRLATARFHRLGATSTGSSGVSDGCRRKRRRSRRSGRQPAAPPPAGGGDVRAGDRHIDDERVDLGCGRGPRHDGERRSVGDRARGAGLRRLHPDQQQDR